MGGKKGPKCRPSRLAATVNNGNVEKEIENSDEEFIAAAERDFKRCTIPPKDHFERIIAAAYPHHQYPVKHKLRDCTMMRRLKSSASTPSRSDKLARDPRGGGTVLGDPEVATIAS
jgi:hypothetical protein